MPEKEAEGRSDIQNSIERSIPRWDKEADVVVVGYGGAGAVAAITVTEKGGKVILLEKAPEPGGNTITSNGGMKVCDNAEKGAQYLKALGLGSIDEETAKVFADTWVEMTPWLKQRGARLVLSELPPKWKFPGVDTFTNVAYLEGREGYKMGCGIDLFAFLDSLVQKLGVQVMLNTPAKRLIQNPTTREILGVIAESGGKEITIKTKKAVIMTCGGFEGNREMLATYIEGAPVPIYASGTPYNTGDGIKMAIDVGADLCNMNGIEWAIQGLKVPEFPAAFWILPADWSWINVNRYGKRFRKESDTYNHTKRHIEVFHFDKAKTEWPNHPWYMIFDEKTRKAGSIIMVEWGPGRAPFMTYNIASGLYTPSPDNSKEIEKGWIKQADTIAALATKTGVDQVELQETITKYNGYCRGQNPLDPDFQRNPLTLKPIDTPPYYSIECAVNIINTQGGPRRNAKFQVMSPYGTPIPRLYSGGELGSIWSYFYPGASNLSECIISGMIAGRKVVAEKPWE